MTIAVDLGRKANKQTKHKNAGNVYAVQILNCIKEENLVQLNGGVGAVYVAPIKECIILPKFSGDRYTGIIPINDLTGT